MERTDEDGHTGKRFAPAEDGHCVAPCIMRSEQQEKLRKIFDHFDENKDGQISTDEMSRSLQKLGFPVSSPEELFFIMQLVDNDEDGFVDFPEFSHLCYSLNICHRAGDAVPDSVHDEVRDVDDGLADAFNVFDMNGDGYISAKELHSVLLRMGMLHGRTVADCQSMISKVDADGNGQVDFQEFKKMMAS